MNENYQKLFQELTSTVSILAEQVMDYDEKNNLNGLEHAEMLHTDFNVLHDKLMTTQELTKEEYTKLLTGVFIVINNIQNQIASRQRAVHNYKTDVMAKLQRIVNEATDDDSANILAQELFK